MLVFQIHFYCSSCQLYIGKDKTQGHCEACQEPFCSTVSLKDGNFFIYIPVEQQIKELLSNDKLYNILTNRDLDHIIHTDIVSDVTSSQLYKELVSHHGFSGNDLSLLWNTDGIPVFNSSKYSVWPLQASVNELPPHLRTENMLLVGLWFGDKPCMNTFFKPFVSECRKLQEDGFLYSNEVKPRKVYYYYILFWLNCRVPRHIAHCVAGYAVNWQREV